MTGNAYWDLFFILVLSGVVSATVTGFVDTVIMKILDGESLSPENPSTKVCVFGTLSYAVHFIVPLVVFHVFYMFLGV